jgi:hypothetical protein
MNNSSKTGLSLIETYEHDAKLGLLVPNNHEDKVSRFVAPKQSAPRKNTKDQQKYTVVVISDILQPQDFRMRKNSRSSLCLIQFLTLPCSACCLLINFRMRKFFSP